MSPSSLAFKWASEGNTALFASLVCRWCSTKKHSLLFGGCITQCDNEIWEGDEDNGAEDVFSGG